MSQIMTTREILKYACDNGFDSVLFNIKNGDERQICVGKFLDAYYEFIQIPVLGDGFIRIGDLENQLGYDIKFEVIDEEAYFSGAFLDFILRGKPVPEDIKNKVNTFNQSE